MNAEAGVSRTERGKTRCRALTTCFVFQPTPKSDLNHIVEENNAAEVCKLNHNTPPPSTALQTFGLLLPPRGPFILCVATQNKLRHFSGKASAGRLVDRGSNSRASTHRRCFPCLCRIDDHKAEQYQTVGLPGRRRRPRNRQYSYCFRALLRPLSPRPPASLVRPCQGEARISTWDQAASAWS